MMESLSRASGGGGIFPSSSTISNASSLSTSSVVKTTTNSPTGQSQHRQKRLGRGGLVAATGGGGRGSEGNSTMYNNNRSNESESSSKSTTAKLGEGRSHPGDDSDNDSINQIINTKFSSLSLAPPPIVLPKPTHSGTIALACVNNSLQMGVITKFHLCPQGKARKTLVTGTRIARESSRTRNMNNGGMGRGSVGGGRYNRNVVVAGSSITNNNNNNNNNLSVDDRKRERMEELFLKNPPPIRGGDGGGSDEEYYSSGDDDDFDGSFDDSQPPPTQPHQQQLQRERGEERHFVPTAPDAASTGIPGRVAVLGGGGGSTTGMNSKGKLPFNYRKVRYFDTITANESGIARKFLRGEINNARRARGMALSEHIKRARLCENGESVEDETMLSSDIRAGEIMLSTALTRFPQEMTPPLAASLIIESLTLNSQESVEGMAKCYDGIVSAGTALLDVTNSSNNNDSGSSGGVASTPGSKKPKLTTSEIMAALAPLLITTLEQSSGEVLVSLSKLRNYCGTRRYRRRFVQRIAPCLVRPPNAAMWCLRHQSDMEPIVAAVEMILDNALEVFSPGWYERGRSLLKDTRRAENLRNAATSLRRLKSGVSVIAFGSLSINKGKGGIRDLCSDSYLSELEIAAIDKGVRLSITDIFSKDWSRIGTLSTSPKDSEISLFGTRQRRGISTAKSKEWDSPNVQSSSLTKSPRTTTSNHPGAPLSPWGHAAGTQLPSPELLESTFGPSFSSQNVYDEIERPNSPPPLSPNRDLNSSKMTTPKTPPHYSMDYVGILLPNLQGEHSTQNSPSRRSTHAPLSPQSSVGLASVSSMTSGVSTNQMSATREQFRALTSTAAERKRTVAACRALRAQITQFEDAFIHMHGRAPKGAAERAPLASTYMQYREWKRAIRADAACRIQVLFRGARVRQMLRRGGEGSLVADFVDARRSYEMAVSSQRPMIHLSIPMNIGAKETDVAKSRTRLNQRGEDVGDGVEVEIVQSPVTPGASSSTSPNNWRNRQQPPQQQQRSPQQSQQSPVGGGDSPTMQMSPRSRSALPEVSMMSLAELQQRKRELKQQLKLYDMNFHAQHGRMPEKREKEPIRHLYESYNAYKNQISVIEKGEAQPGPGTAAFRSTSYSPTSSDIMNPSAPGNNVSPVTATVTTSPAQKQKSEALSSNPSSYSTTAADETPHLARLSSEGTDNSDTNNSLEDINDGGFSSSEIGEDLTSLKAEKATLHQMLRSYEKDFFRQHKRQVSSFADIRPVASQYRRYKEIKKAIAQKSTTSNS